MFVSQWKKQGILLSSAAVSVGSLGSEVFLTFLNLLALH